MFSFTKLELELLCDDCMLLSVERFIDLLLLLVFALFLLRAANSLLEYCLACTNAGLISISISESVGGGWLAYSESQSDSMLRLAICRRIRNMSIWIGMSLGVRLMQRV